MENKLLKLTGLCLVLSLASCATPKCSYEGNKNLEDYQKKIYELNTSKIEKISPLLREQAMLLE